MSHSASPLRIVFMGTPDFAVPSLDILWKHGFEMAAVVTAPDKPAGRGLQLRASAVKQYAVSKGIPVLQPVRLKDPAFQDSLRALGADVQVVVAFRMLPEAVWSMPRLGTLNLHASLLPAYRGAAPINWAIIRGETETGVTTFKLQQEIDTGAVIFQEKLPIGPDETAGALHDRLMETGARLMLRTLEAMAAGDYPLIPQQSPEAAGAADKTAPKIFKEDCRIRWEQPLSAVYDLIRGLSPYPGAWTQMNGKVLKIYKAKKIPAEAVPLPGTVSTDQAGFMHIAAGGGWIAVESLQLEGKKRMEIREFLRGFREMPQVSG